MDTAERHEDSPVRSYPEEQAPTSSHSSLSVIDKLSVLPDELVCIGLNQQYEGLWREKVVKALFFYEDILSVSPESGRLPPNIASRVQASDSTTVSPSPDRPRPQRLESYTNTPDTTSLPLPDLPTPFFSLTQTTEGTSLTSDIRILRRLFPSDEEGQNIVYAAGGGLWGLWKGEEDPYSASSLPDDVRNEAERPRGRSRTRRDPEEEEDWERVETDLSARFAKTTVDWDSGRKLLKCIQLDLSSAGLGELNRPC
jgi:hypothetical protein